MKRVLKYGFVCLLLVGVFHFADKNDPLKVAYDRGGEPLTIASTTKEV
ncbi:hypothetical protein [Tumebacillus permanentifrigoris]|uniref:Uncharacterized protein n=1 Tax=Tumebacillus permanentifrigoris TaxID=378543 RepID=A0A316D6K1_9BACL|nr:hypothetical protein [Tumebacillus permanentifrigoris]PWK07408.1 hypothetical protein C7459_1176 [Tumebacillus permanentifrigoris]